MKQIKTLSRRSLVVGRVSPLRAVVTGSSSGAHGVTRPTFSVPGFKQRDLKMRPALILLKGEQL